MKLRTLDQREIEQRDMLKKRFANRRECLPSADSDLMAENDAPDYRHYWKFENCEKRYHLKNQPYTEAK